MPLVFLNTHSRRNFAAGAWAVPAVASRAWAWRVHPKQKRLGDFPVQVPGRVLPHCGE
ncbi:MAG: hypothetical protein K6T65_12075 [Peptococcaceae bacterium]|nr:hypothetical protein [Peptococcaceae bacterium]